MPETRPARPPASAAPRLACVVETERLPPVADGFVRNGDAALGEQIFHITETQAESVSRPGELHPQPLVERYVNLSAHTAPIRRTHLSSRRASRSPNPNPSILRWRSAARASAGPSFAGLTSAAARGDDRVTLAGHGGETRHGPGAAPEDPRRQRREGRGWSRGLGVRRRRWRDPRRGRLRLGGRARPNAVPRPHAEPVGLAVGQVAHRVAGGRPARGGPGVGPVQLVFVMRDRRPAGGLDPTEPHLPVAGRGAEAVRRVRRPQRGSRRGKLQRGGPARPDAVHRPHAERVERAVGQVAHRVAGGRPARGGPGPGPVLLVFVAQDRRPAVRRGRRPAQIHPLVADRGAQARRRVRLRRGRDARRRGGGRARPDAVDRPHLERVGLAVDAPICQNKRLGCLRDVFAHAEVCHNTLVDFTGEEAFEAADDLASGQATTHRHSPVSLNDPDRHRDDAHSQVANRVAGGCPARGGPGAGTVRFVFVVRDRRPAVRRGRRPAQIHLLVAGRGAQARRRAGHRGRGDARRAPYHPMTQGSTSSSSRSTVARRNLAGGGRRRRTADHVPGVGSREDWRPRVSTMNSWSESYREHRRPNVLNQATAAWA